LLDIDPPLLDVIYPPLLDIDADVLDLASLCCKSKLYTHGIIGFVLFLINCWYLQLNSSCSLWNASTAQQHPQLKVKSTCNKSYY